MTEPLFQNPWITVDMVDAVHGDGTPYQHTRVTLGHGAVTVPFTRVGGAVKVGLVKTFRPALDQPLVEFPRGGISARTREEALREVGEEFGLGDKVYTFPSRHIGEIFPDSGYANHVDDVWAIYLDPATAASTEGFREDETGGVVQWMSVDALRIAIKSGDVKDSFTLATLLLAELHGVFDELGA